MAVPSKERKVIYVVIRFTESMRAALDRAAFAHGLSNSEYIRRVLETALAQEQEKER